MKDNEFAYLRQYLTHCLKYEILNQTTGLIMRTILYEFGDGTKITVETEFDDYIDKMKDVVEELADDLDTNVEVEEL